MRVRHAIITTKQQKKIVTRRKEVMGRDEGKVSSLGNLPLRFALLNCDRPTDEAAARYRHLCICATFSDAQGVVLTILESVTPQSQAHGGQ